MAVEVEEAAQAEAIEGELHLRQQAGQRHPQVPKLGPTVRENPIATTAGQLMDTGL